MRRVFNAISIIICVLFLFCGCSSLYEDNDLRDIPQLTANQKELTSKNRRIDVNLYFYKDGTDELIAETRNIIIEEGREEEAVLDNLLIGSFTQGYSNAAEATAKEIEIMDNVANIYLSCNNQISDKNKYKLAAQIADTLIDFFKIEFICVFYNEEAVNISGYPIGALKKSDGYPMKLYEELNNLYELSSISPVNISINTVLYFIDSTGKYFLPEVRLIKVIGQFDDFVGFNRAFIKSVVSELAEGPESKYYLLTYVSSQYLADENYDVKYDGNEIRASRDSGIFYFRCDAELAAFYYTIAGIVPLKNDMLISKQFSTQTFNINRNSSKDYAGCTITLYIPNKDATGLTTVKKIVKQSSTSDLKSYMRSLFMELNNTGYFEGIITFRYLYVNSISVSEDTVIIDFTDEFIEDFKRVDPKMQKMVIYSIINTMEKLFFARDTLIRADGKVPEGICEDISLEYPLMANYGLLI